ncbi:MAG TPA: YraN family protein [Gaiellaceae bacterium]
MNGGERRALVHYLLRGYRPLGWNVRAGRNELDLIVRRGRKLVFVEVKEKRGPGFGHPLEMVDAEKRRRVRRAAAAWLASHREHAGLEIGFEVVGIREGRLVRVADDLTER